MRIFSKTILLTAAVLFVCAFCFAQKKPSEIDQLRSKDDVRNFLTKRISHRWKKKYIWTDISDADSTKLLKELFYKLDLNNDGRNDLLVNGNYLFAVIDLGHNKYEVHNIDYSDWTDRKYTLIKIENRTSPLLLILADQTWDNQSRNNTIFRDTIGLTADMGFIEYNPNPLTVDIKQINLRTTMCFGTCPVFELTINDDQAVMYNAIQFNKVSGMFYSKLSADKLKKISSLINYINKPSLKDHYAVEWTDDQSVILDIKFKNGQVKHITDYGEIGTLGLRKLYALIFNLRNELNWKKNETN